MYVLDDVYTDVYSFFRTKIHGGSINILASVVYFTLLLYGWLFQESLDLYYEDNIYKPHTSLKIIIKLKKEEDTWHFFNTFTTQNLKTSVHTFYALSCRKE